jgi:hypothetical protein
MIDEWGAEHYVSVQRRVRLLTLFRAASDVGLDPLPIGSVHALAYLTDALSPVWHLPPLDATLLKRVRRPFFPALQRDLDALIGRGLVEVVRFAYVSADDGHGWQLEADFRLMPDAALTVLTAAQQFGEQVSRATFAREVVYAASGLGAEGVDSIPLLDATYSNPLVDVGGVVDVGPGGTNATAEAALAFVALAGESRRLSEPELVHLYVRHLYARMVGA